MEQSLSSKYDETKENEEVLEVLTKGYTYYWNKWDDWSEWSTTEAVASDIKKVETRDSEQLILITFSEHVNLAVLE